MYNNSKVIGWCCHNPGNKKVFLLISMFYNLTLLAKLVGFIVRYKVVNSGFVKSFTFYTSEAFLDMLVFYKKRKIRHLYYECRHIADRGYLLLLPTSWNPSKKENQMWYRRLLVPIPKKQLIEKKILALHCLLSH